MCGHIVVPYYLFKSFITYFLLEIMEFRASFSAQAATIRNTVVLRQRRFTLVKLQNYNVVNGDSEWSNKALDTAYSTTWCEFNPHNTAPNEVRVNEG
jgi:hypothetical protein